MINYSNKETNKIPEFEIGDEKELSKFEWTGWIKLIFDKSINFIWRM